MIKKYNQFVKENKTNEDFEVESPAPVKQMPSLGKRPASVEPVGFEEEEETEMDKYQTALVSLADLAGVEYNEGDRSVVINGKNVIFPAETEKYHIEGVKKKFSTAEEVMNYLEGGSVEGGSTHQPQLPTIKNEMPQEEMELELQESKSYKKRFKK